MQITQPPADGGGQIADARGDILQPVVIAGVQGIQRPGKLVVDPAPAITLIADEALRHGDGAALIAATIAVLATLPDQLAQEVGDTGIAGGGEMAGHFGFRIDAGGETADQLDHGGLADDQRTVGLFGAKPAHRRIGRDRCGDLPRLVGLCSGHPFSGDGLATRAAEGNPHALTEPAACSDDAVRKCKRLL